MKNIINRLNKRIEIQEKTIINDNQGGFIENWKTIMNIYAEIKPINTANEIQAENITNIITHIITVRYSKLIKNEHRIKYKDRIFYINGIIDCLESNTILEIRAQEEK